MAGRGTVSASRMYCRAFHSSRLAKAQQHSYQFVVAGGGAGGLAVASTLTNKFGTGRVAVVEPSDIEQIEVIMRDSVSGYVDRNAKVCITAKSNPDDSMSLTHYYQPMWTLVGGGVKQLGQSMKAMQDVIPKKATWFKSAVAEFSPDENAVVTADGDKLKYDFLIVAVGMKINYHKIAGLTEALEDPNSPVTTNYSSKYAPKTFQLISNYKGGDAIFTMPPLPIKCPGAPQKIMYLADDYFRKHGTRGQGDVIFNSALGVIFGVKKYADALWKVVERKGIKVNLQRKLVMIRPREREAVFEVLDPEASEEQETFEYSMLHVTPPMGPLDVMMGSPISDTAGWVDVNKETLQHNQYSNVFALGDCSSVPTSKTAAAVAGESGVLKDALFSVMSGKPVKKKYDGYTSCPLITEVGKTIMAEFDFNGQPLETFPIDQGKERMTMYYLKADIMPELYWNGLLKGVWGGPTTLRRLLSLGTRR